MWGLKFSPSENWESGEKGISDAMAEVNVELRRVIGVNYPSSDNSISCFLIPLEENSVLGRPGIRIT